MMESATARRSARLRQKRPLASSADANNHADPAPSERYASLKVSELRDLLRHRGLTISGVKSALIERLLLASQANDESSPATTKSNDETENHSNYNNASVISRCNAKRAMKKSMVSSESVARLTSSAKTPSRDPAFAVDCLPRTRELQLRSANTDLVVIGVDEAGRGPLAGPVVAAAAIVPTDISGIIDSKKITKEEERERLYEQLVASPDIRYAVAVISARRIDEINILQATLEGMRMAVEAVIEGRRERNEKDNLVSAERDDLCYVVTGGGKFGSYGDSKKSTTNNKSNNNSSYHALIDGNKIPKGMPCPCESLVKGDGREFAIGAASILAKVTRDRLMHEYSEKYPDYNLSQHKGYPTAAHMAAVGKFGASPIHRRTFAPLKHMEFDDDGKVVG